MVPVEFISHRVSDTERLGEALGALLQAGDVVCMAGPLGAGKTAMTRGIGAGWGAREPITSPTFTLIHEHHRPRNEQVMYHVDCYRLQTAADAGSTGLEDLFHGDDIVVIEWPENALSLLPDERLWLTLEDLGDSQRRITARATGARYESLLGALRRRLHHV